MPDSPAMAILFCFALKEEAAPFQKIVAGKPGIAVLLTGIGRENAEKSVRDFLDSSRSRRNETQTKIETPHVDSFVPVWVLTCGFAGGLNPDLKLGDVVSEPGIRNPEVGVKLAAAGAKPARFFCADRIAVTIAEKKRLREQTGADAVEMESAAIHAVCAEHGIPCATTRVISDTADEDLPLDFNALAKPDKNLDIGKLLLAVAKSPRKIGALMKLQKQTRFAAERLAEVLAKVV